MEKYAKIGLSVFIVYHLSAVILAPLNEGYLPKRSAFLFERYLNLFAFMAGWAFFAPEPGPPPIFLEWELFDKDKVLLETERFPAFPDTFFFRERQNRRIAATRFLLNEENLPKSVLSPYLCTKHPGTQSVKVFSLVFPVPSLDEVANGTRFIGDSKIVKKTKLFQSTCNRLE